MASVTDTRSSDRAAARAAERVADPVADRSARRRRRRAFSPLTLRILAVNVFALAVLVGGLLYLGRYQDRLIEAELHALATEARIFASAIGEGAVVRLTDGPPGEDAFALSPELARQMVRRLVEATETRTRLFAPSGVLVSDSRVLVGSPGAIQIEELPAPPPTNPAVRWVKAGYARIIDLIPSREAFPLHRDLPPHQGAAHPDVQRALAGEPSASVWRAPAAEGPPQLMLTVAVPVQRFKQVQGAVHLARSGQDIDSAIRSVRLDILRVFAVALGVTVLLSFYLAGAIARPIHRLAAAAERVRHGHGRPGKGERGVIPDFTARGDEIGDLSAALGEMTEALWARMDAIERFAADVAHEIKNPLTSLRSAVETAAAVRDPDRRERLMAIIADDVQRLDRLISDISNASRLDAELSRAALAPLDAAALLRTLADIHAETAAGAPRLEVDVQEGADLTVKGLEGRLTQVFQNLIANALSFSPPGGVVRLSARRAGGMVEVAVEDEGPGIPDGKEETIFERFYSDRPAGEKFGAHSGLGLSISRQIVEAHGGSITAATRRDPDGRPLGAVFVVRLPLG